MPLWFRDCDLRVVLFSSHKQSKSSGWWCRFVSHTIPQGNNSEDDYSSIHSVHFYIYIYIMCQASLHSHRSSYPARFFGWGSKKTNLENLSKFTSQSWQRTKDIGCPVQREPPNISDLLIFFNISMISYMFYDILWYLQFFCSLTTPSS